MPEPSAEYQNLRLEELNYNSYLRVPELLSLQRQLSDPPHHDEMFFIVIHQSFELWFKEVLHETDLLLVCLREGSISRVLKILKRVQGILECLVRQIRLLETLTPVEFAGFRDRLKPASGFQSVQFREIEYAYGLREDFFLRFFAGDEAATARLRRRLQEPSVWDEALRCLAREGVPVPARVLERDVSRPHLLDEELVAVLQDLYEDPGTEYHRVLLLEALLDVDSLFSQWRAVHILMVSRTIGGVRGTGGSSGREFLESRLPHRFFPELWELRSRVQQERETGA